MRVIPAIDIIGGKCVRLTQGNYALQKTYHDDPLDVAQAFEAAGLRALHLVDLDGARAGSFSNWEIVGKICKHTQLLVDVGGGIKTEHDIRKLLDLGVQQVNLGSIAVREPGLVNTWIEQLGHDRIILSADVRNGKIAISGWQENLALDVDTLIGQFPRLKYVTCTDISVDGMLAGPNLQLYGGLVKRFPSIMITASGGVGSVADLKQLQETGVFAAIVGKALYEGLINPQTLREEFDDAE